MAVQRIKIWQWVLISLVAWAIAGMVLVSSEDLSGPGDLNRQVFFRELHATAEDGRPLINDLMISPVIQSANGRSVQRVKFTRLMRNRETGEVNALPGDFIAEIPFIKTDENADNRIGDYLAGLKTRVPELNYRYAWWQLSGLESEYSQTAIGTRRKVVDFITDISHGRFGQAIRGGVPFDRELHWWQYPRGMWIVLLVVSVITIGIIWPMIIKLLVKLGFGLPPEELAAFDLRHVSSKTKTDAPERPAVTDADRDALDDLNAALEQNVSGMLVTDNSLDDAHERKQEAAMVKKLSNQPAEAASVDAKADDPKDYTGEFYPVARPHGQK